MNLNKFTQMKAIETIIAMFFVMVVMTVIHGQSPSVKASVANNGADREPPPALLPEVRTEVEKRF